MSPPISFDEDTDSFSHLQPVKVESAIVKAGVVRNSTQANFLFLILALFLIGGVVFFLKISLPPLPPELRDDIPRRGEVIPENRTL